MAGGNVIRQDVVQISFDVVDGPMKEIQSMIDGLTGKAKGAVNSVNGITKEAQKAASEVKEIGSAAKQAASGAQGMSEPIKETADSAKDAEVKLSSMVKALASSVTGKIKQLPTVIKSSATAAREFAASLKANIADGAIKGVKKLKSGFQAIKNIKLKDVIEGVDKGLGKAVTSAKKLATNLKNAAVDKLKSTVEKLKSSFSGANKGAKETAQSAKSIKTAVDDATKSTKKLSEGFTIVKGAIANIVSNALASLISGIKDLAVNTLQVGMNFESSMSNVEALQKAAGATEADIQMLNETAKQFGATTQFSATEAADALGYMALAGWDAETSAANLGGVLDLAAASGMELAAASDMVTDYLSAFSNSAMTAQEFADKLAYAQANSNTTAAMLGEAYRNSAANLNAAGQDIDTVTSLLSSMANQGLKGSEAGTALSAMMRDLTSKMKSGQVQIGDTAVSVQDAQGNFRDLTDVLKDVEAATEGMGDAQKQAALRTIFGDESIKGLNLVLNDGIDKIAAFEDELRSCSGSAKEMADIMNDNLEGDVKKLQSAFEGLQLTLFDKMNPALREGTRFITDMVSEIDALATNARSASDYGEGFGKILTGALSALVAKLPEYTAIGREFIIGLISGIGNGMPDLMMTLTEAALNGLSSISQQLPAFVDAGISLITGIANGIMQAAPEMVNRVPEIVQGLADGLASGALSLLETVIGSGVPELIMSLMMTLAAAILDSLSSTIGQQLPAFIKAGIALVNGIVDGVMQALPELINRGPEIVLGLFEGLEKGAIALLEGGIELVEKIISGIKDGLPKFTEKGTELVEGFAERIRTYLPQIVQLGIKLILTLIQGIAQTLPQLLGTAISLVTTLLQAFMSMLPDMLMLGVKALLQLISGLASAMPQLVITALQLITEFVQTLLTMLPQLVTIGVQALFSLVNGIIEALPQVIAAGLQIVLQLIQSIVTLLPQLVLTGITLIIQLALGLIQAIPKVIEAAGAIVDGIVNAILTTDWLAVGWDIISGIASGIWEGIKSLGSSIWSSIKGMFTGGDSGEAQAAGSNTASQYSAGITAGGGSVSTAASSLATTAADSLTFDSFTLGSNLTTDFATGMNTGILDVTTNMQTMKLDMTNIATQTSTDVTTQFNTMGTNMQTATQAGSQGVMNTMHAMQSQLNSINLYSTGQNIMRGLVSGMESMRGALMATAQSIASSISATMNGALDVHSPSKVTEETGKFVDLGAIQGMKKLMPKVEKTSFAVGETIAGNVGYAETAPVAPSYGGSTTTNNYNPTFVLNMNGASATDDNKKKVKQWIKESLKEIFEDMDRDNPEVWEV